MGWKREEAQVKNHFALLVHFLSLLLLLCHVRYTFCYTFVTLGDSSTCGEWACRVTSLCGRQCSLWVVGCVLMYVRLLQERVHHSRR
jgi:hypothetical protein